jgi:hypothetical protein
VKKENLSSLLLNYRAATSRRQGISRESFFCFPGRASIPLSGRKPEKLRRRLRVFGCGSVSACHPDHGDLQTRARMFQHEVFGKRQSIRPGSTGHSSLRFDPAGTGSIGLARRPERMLILVPASRDSSPGIALIDKAHRGSSFYNAQLSPSRNFLTVPFCTALTGFICRLL